MKKNNRSIKFYIIFAAVALFTVGIGIFAFTFIEEKIEEQQAIEAEKASVVENLKSENQEPSDTIRVNEDLTEEETAAFQVKTENDNTAIAKIHDRFNDMTGWGRYHDFDFDDSNDLSRVDRIQEQIENVIKQSSDEALIGDFTNALLVIEKAMENEDIQGILYAHRIFHDLDIHINNYGSKQVFGITEWKSGRQPRAINRYLD